MLVPIFVQPQSVVRTAEGFDPMQYTRQKNKKIMEKDTDAVTDNNAERDVFGWQATQCTARYRCSQAGNQRLVITNDERSLSRDQLS